MNEGFIKTIFIATILCALYLCTFVQCYSRNPSFSKNGPPRFKQNVRRDQYVYLGDNTRFKCSAVGRPQPKVHWFRDSVYLNFSVINGHPRYRENDNGMTFDIKRVEVGDKGNWTCRVWNHEGYAMRNFTLHVIDFCDYFNLNMHIAVERVPEECLCQWKATNEIARNDIALDEFNSTICDKYSKEITEIQKYASATAQPIPFDEIDRLPRRLPLLLPDNELSNDNNSAAVFTGQSAGTLDVDAKIQHASAIVDGMSEDSYEESVENENDVEVAFHTPTEETPQFYSLPLTGETTALPLADTDTSTQTTRPTTTRSRIMPTTRKWPMPLTSAPISRVPPYFKQTDDQVTRDLVLPAGRTMKLSCKAGGQPEPQVVWRKENMEIHRDTERKTGSLYKIRKWSLEAEDASESDSGNYVCEVFNHAGQIKRRFRVDIRDRIRSRPIIVPNVLINQTADVNSTVNFTCQVISDLVPHIVWIKLVETRNGSYIRWDASKKQHVFSFVDMSTVKKARIYHNNETKTYTLELRNVSMADQGIYSCVAGNTLGMNMANATLTVNEFRAMTLPTENPYSSWNLWYTTLLLLSVALIFAFVGLSIMYFYQSNNYNKGRVQTLDKMSVRKRVIITKKSQKDGEVLSDLVSSYAITVEPIISDERQPIINSDVSTLSEYEVPTDVAWEIDRTRLKLLDVLGEGAFGEVWRGMLRPKYVKDDEEGAKEIPVAVKKLKRAAQEKELIILVSEMQIFKSIGEHKNILKLIGCCTGFGPLLVVLELCPHGNLRDFLRKHRPRDHESETQCNTDDTSHNYTQSRQVIMYQNMDDPQEAVIKNLTLRDLVQFATEIARGMEFLASKKIIHRDLAARNILVSENYTMKISDFGLSRNVFYHDYYRKRGADRLPIKWMSPESLEANVYTTATDVWSYGILLYEIMTLGGTPYPSIAMPQLYNLLKEGYRMEAPHNCPEEIYGVMVMCWQEKPDARPQFQTIADYFDWMLAESANYHHQAVETNKMRQEEGYAIICEARENGRRKIRPLSAPGLMSFEAFVIQENANINAKSTSANHTKEATEEVEETDEHSPLIKKENSRKLPPSPNVLKCDTLPVVKSRAPSSPFKATTPTENHYLNAAPTKHLQENSDGFFIDSGIGSPLWPADMEPYRQSPATYSNDFKPHRIMESMPDPPPPNDPGPSRKTSAVRTSSSSWHNMQKNNDYANDVGYDGTKASSSTTASIPKSPTACRFPFAATEQGLTPHKLSTVSSHSAVMVNKPSPIPRDNKSAKPSKASSNVLNNMHRSLSVDSARSSGHGGSSAMSSAEGLGGVGELCQIEYILIHPDQANSSRSPQTNVKTNLKM